MEISVDLKTNDTHTSWSYGLFFELIACQEIFSLQMQRYYKVVQQGDLF